ncbi:MAG: tetratricopeptide repeat protein [Candidatus Heimdallarchaeota archaeon]|nr:tetratricopeptide repeat protein [Candidatus Heimdallarchaeota archaeon]
MSIKDDNGRSDIQKISKQGQKLLDNYNDQDDDVTQREVIKKELQEFLLAASSKIKHLSLVVSVNDLLPLLLIIRKIAKVIDEKKEEAKVLSFIGLSYRNIGSFQKALDFYQSSLDIMVELGDLLGQGELLTNIGEVHASLFNFEKALEYYQKARRISISVSDYELEAAVLNNLGVLFRSQGNYSQAFNYCQRALELSKKVEDSEGESTALNNLGILYRVRGKYKQALNFFHRSIEIEKGSSNQRGLATSFNNIGLVYLSKGDFENALDYFFRSLEISQQLEDKLGQVVILNNIGLVFDKKGDLQEALDYFERAFNLAKEFNDKEGEAVSLNNQARVYSLLDKHQKAINYNKSALEIQKGISDKEGQGSTLHSLGSVNIFLKNYQQALTYFQQALEIFDELNIKDGQVRTLHNIGRVHYYLEQYPEALHYYQESLDQIKQLEDQAGEGIILDSIGATYLRMGNYPKALELFQQALKIIETVGDKITEGKILTNLGIIYLLSENYQKSYDVLLKAIDIVELLVGEIESEEMRKGYRATKLSTFNVMIYLLFSWFLSDELEETESSELLLEAFKFLEMVKAREIANKLENEAIQKDLMTLCPAIQELIIKEQQLAQKISDYYQQSSANQQSVVIGSRSIKTTQQVLSHQSPSILNQWISELREYRKKVLEECPEPGLILQTKEYDPLPSFKELFDYEPNAVVWEFFYDERLTPDRFWILYWSKDNLDLYVSNPIDVGKVLNLLEEFNQNLETKQMTKANNILLRLADLLGETLPEILWELLTNKELLVIIPHDKLHSLPWGLVKKPAFIEERKAENFQEANSQNYLGLKIPIVRSYSLKIVTSCFQREKEMKQKILLVANPNFNIPDLNLPESEKEVDSIIDLVKSSEDSTEILSVLKQQKATKESFLELINSEPSIVHFAGHGEFNARDPWLSSLLFYSENGFTPLTVTELLANHFTQSPLVILNACETAHGKIRKGDEILGLLRAVILTGATSVIVTNWLLSEKIAPLFMKKFYQYLLQGKTTANALFFARKGLYEEGFIKPIDWAVYEFYGNPFKRMRE